MIEVLPSVGADNLAALLLTMARSMVDDPQEARVKIVDPYLTGRTHGQRPSCSARAAAWERAVTLILIVADGDVGKVIGKGGANANAMRTVLGAAAGAMRLRVTLEIPAPARPRKPLTPCEHLG